MRDDYLEKTYAETAAKLGLIKGRVYVDDPSEAPEGANVQQGEQDGYYYETDGGSGGSEGNETPVGNEEAGSPPEGARSQEELVAEYAEMSPEERRERAEQYLETAQMAEEAGEDDLRALMMSRLQALDEVSESGDAMSE